MPIAAHGLRILAAIAVALLLVGHPASALQAFAPIPQILFGIFLVAAMPARPLFDRTLKMLELPSDRVFLVAAMGIALATMTAANVFVLERVPHVTDSTAYLFQAKLIAAGRLTESVPALPEFFLSHFFYIENDRLISLFQPGWPAILALGVWLGVPWLVNPLLGSLTLWPLYRIARRAVGRRVARLAVLLLLLSPFFTFMAASFMAHTASALISLWALDLTLGYRRDPRVWRALVTAILVGGLFCIRAYNALLLLIPLSAILLPDLLRRRVKAAHLAWALVALFMVGGLQLLANLQVTGSALTFPQDRYFAQTEKVASCHRLGFGADVGCANEHGKYGFPKGFYAADGLTVTRQRLSSLALNFYGTPLALLLIALPLAGGRIRRESWALLLHFGALLGGYFFFYYHGNCYGPRFYYEAVGTLGVFAALGFWRLDGWLERVADRLPSSRAFWRALAPAFLVTIVVFNLGWLSPKLWQSYQGFRGIDGRMRDILADAGVTNALVFIPGPTRSFIHGFNFNDAGFDTDVLFARHLKRPSVQLARLYPDRTPYRYEAYRDRLIRLEVPPFSGVEFVEAEAKVPPKAWQGGFPSLMWIDRFFPDDRDAQQLFFEADEANAFFRFDHFLPEAGAYRVEVRAMHGPFMGDWQLSVNGQPIDSVYYGYSPGYGFGNWSSAEAIDLPRGPIRLTFTVAGKDPQSHHFDIGLDSLIFRRIPDGLGRPIPDFRDLGYMSNGQLHPLGPGGAPPLERR